ncbi:MAG: hypothetical protein PVG99_06710 [Desulfobacteraceae bacterium]|jgi:hypothetical protein
MMTVTIIGRWKTFTAFAVGIAGALFLEGCSGSEVETYNKFEFSFEYPGKVDVVERGTPLFGKKASHEAGNLRIGTTSDLTDGKVEAIFMVAWFPAQQADRAEVMKIVGAALKGRQQGHDLHLGGKVELDQEGHRVWGARFCTQGKEGILLNVAGAWYCDVSKRIFHLTSAARWENPTFIMSGSGAGPEWPDAKKDSSFKAYEKLLRSFHCHLAK